VEIALENMLVSGAGVGVAPTSRIAAVNASSEDPIVFCTSEKASAVLLRRTLRRSFPVDGALLARFWEVWEAAQ